MSWLGEVKEQTWRLALSPDAVFRRVEKNTELPVREGGPAFSSGRVVSHLERHSFRLHVTSIIGGRGSPIPVLRAEVRDDGDGSTLTFSIRISPHSVILWLPGLMVAGMIGLLYLVAILIPLVQGRPDDATGAALGGLFCASAFLVPLGLIQLFTILRARSMSARMMNLMLDLFERDRVPNDETPPEPAGE